MTNLRLAPGVKPTRAKRGTRKPSRRRRHHSGWWTTAKVVFLLERRRRRRKRQASSPSVRQIALIVVSAGLAILVIRVASQRVRSHAGSAPAQTQGATGEASAPEPTPHNDTVTGESELTDRVQSEMSRRDDAPTPTAGAD